jgi:hypothetical protein
VEIKQQRKKANGGGHWAGYIHRAIKPAIVCIMVKRDWYFKRAVSWALQRARCAQQVGHPLESPARSYGWQHFIEQVVRS